MTEKVRSHRIRDAAAAVVIALAGAAPASAEELPPMDCVITPSRTVDVSAAAPGLVAQVNVDRSDEVVAGQIVASLSSDVERMDLDIAKARAEMDAEIHVWEVSLDFNRRNQERLSSLHHANAVSSFDRDKAERDAVLAQWKLRHARDAQQLHRLERRRAEEVLELKTIRSPIAGVVVQRFKSAGEYVEDQPIVRIAQLDPLHVETIVPMSLYGRITTGMDAQVLIEGSETPQLAKVSAVDRMGDAASGTFGVRLSLPNPDYALPAGMKCNVKLVPGPRVADRSISGATGVGMRAPGPGARSAAGEGTDADVTRMSAAAETSLGPILEVRR